MSYPAAMQALLDQFGNQNAIAQKIVQVGSFQPFDLVRVHSNPANLVLTNAHEGSVATSTVVLLTDGQARAGLKFKPDTSVIRDRHDQQLHLIIASGIDQVVTVEFEDYPAKELQVTANQPALFSIGMLFGIPVIASTASFFDVATGEDGGATSGNFAFTSVINAQASNNKVIYTNGDLAAIGKNWAHGFAAIAPFADGQAMRFVVPVLVPNQQIAVYLETGDSLSPALSVAWFKVFATGDSTFVRSIDNGDLFVAAGDVITITRSGQSIIASANGMTATVVNSNVSGTAYLQVFGSHENTADVPVLELYVPGEQA